MAVGTCGGVVGEAGEVGEEEGREGGVVGCCSHVVYERSDVDRAVAVEVEEEGWLSVWS